MLYGSAILLALCNYYHYHTQGYTTMMLGMRNVPSAMEDATTVLGAASPGSYVTFTFPPCASR